MKKCILCCLFFSFCLELMQALSFLELVLGWAFRNPKLNICNLTALTKDASHCSPSLLAATHVHPEWAETCHGTEQGRSPWNLVIFSKAIRQTGNMDDSETNQTTSQKHRQRKPDQGKLQNKLSSFLNTYTV